MGALSPIFLTYGPNIGFADAHPAHPHSSIAPEPYKKILHPIFKATKMRHVLTFLFTTPVLNKMSRAHFGQTVVILGPFHSKSTTYLDKKIVKKSLKNVTIYKH